MGILTKEVEVKLWGKTVKHYNNLGYKGKNGDVIIVKVEDLPKGSNIKIQYLCDYCEKEIITMVYADYTRRTKELDKMACRHCMPQKLQDIMQIRYGVSHYSKTQDYKEKWNSTCTERYGASYRKQFTDKAFETFRDKTGYDYPSQSPEVKKKMAQSYVEHYGVDNPERCAELRERTKQTNLERYGYATPLQSPEIKEKIAQTSYKNGTVPTSKQQLYIFNLYKSVDDSTELNFPISHFHADICFPKEKLTVEVDFGGHNLSVKTGQVTQEEFDKKEIIRNNVIKKEGYKQIHIISSYKLPSDSTLLQMLDCARNYFSFYSNHSWIEFNLNTSIMRNAENKEGVYYSFGALRTIKDGNLNKVS